MVISVLRKARSCSVPNLGCRGTESPRWFDVSPKISAWDVIYAKIYAWVGMLSWWSRQSLVAPNCTSESSNSFCGGMFELITKVDADLLLYLLSYFESNGHTVHMLTQQCLLPPLTSTMKLSLFTYVHSSPLSLAARLHCCCANCYCYINNGWTFSRQTSYKRFKC